MSKASLAVLVLFGLTIPASAQPPQAVANPDLSTVPADACFFASVEVSKLWDKPAAKPLRDWILSQKGGTFDSVFGLPLAELDRVTLFAVTGDPQDGGAPLVLVSTRQKYDEAKLLKAFGADKSRVQRDTLGRTVEINALFRYLVLIDDRTLLYLPCSVDHRAIGPKAAARLAARKADGPLAAALVSTVNHDLTIGVDVREMAEYVKEFRLETDKQFAPYLGLLKANTATVTANLDKDAQVKLYLTFADADAAKNAAPILTEAIKSLAENLGREKDQLPERFDPAEKVVVVWLLSVLKNAKVAVAGSDVVATADVPFSDELNKFVAAMPKQLAAVRNDAKAHNNMKQLALAMHNFESANGIFPSDVTQGGDKLIEHSWRVQILPYLEQAQVANQLDMTKPWDDPKNLQVLENLEMPKVFEFPGRDAPKGHTYFRVFSLPKGAKGTDRPWFRQGERGPRIADISDGTSNTFMIVEAGEAVPWYKPDVLAYDGKLPLPPLGDKNTDRLAVAFGDGSVKSLRPSKLSEKTLRALITTQGGEVVELPK